MNGIRIQNIEKKFGEKTAVYPLSLEIAPNETFGLLGVNGAGKTTLVRMLTCLLEPSGGEAWVAGHSILHESTEVKRCVSASFQETSVAPHLTVEENLRLMARIYGASRAAAAAAADRFIQQFHMASIRTARAGILSGGWQRRLSIALALISQPKVLLLDEPTLGLDVLARRELWQCIAQLKSQMTIVLTTHYLEEAENLCDRIGVMSEGRMLALGTCDALKQQTATDSLEKAFVRLIEGSV